MPVSSSTEHWIKPDALTINLNHFGDPDYLQVSVLAGAVVMAFKQDVIGYNAAHNYRTWPLEAANTYLETSSAYNVYARLTRSEVNARALIVYDTVLRDIEGREITYAQDGSEVLREASTDYFFVFLGQISESTDRNGGKKERSWNIGLRFGALDTTEQKNYTGFLFEKMFRPHYDDNQNPDKITSIEVLSGLWTHSFISAKGISPNTGGGNSGGLVKRVFGYNDLSGNFLNSDLNNTFNAYTIARLASRISYLEQNGGGSGGGGVADSIEWEKVLYKPSWLVDEKPPVSFFNNDAQYITSDALNPYATQQWVNDKGYAIATDVANTYVTKTTFNTLKTDFDNLSALLNDDVQGKINTWHEVVDFLDEYSGSQDLAAILSGMNTDIASRVEKSKFAEYFNSEMAKWFVKDDANKGIKPVNSYGLYSDTYVSAKGVSTGTGGSGGSGTSYDRLDSWAEYTSAKAGYVLSALLGYDLHTRVNNLANAGYITASALSGYAKLSDIPTSLPASDVAAWAKAASKPSYAFSEITNKPTTLGGYGITDAYTATTIDGKLSGYLPLSGGTIEDSIGGAFSVNRINGVEAYITFLGRGVLKGAITAGKDTYGVALYNAVNGYYLGITNDGNPYYLGASRYTLIHSGNIGSQSVNYATNALVASRFPCKLNMGLEANSNEYLLQSDYGSINPKYNIPDGFGYGSIFTPLPSNGSTSLLGQFAWDINHNTSTPTKKLWFRASNDLGWGNDWKTIAFTDSNVASATKLQTARTIWGKSFDGTQNIIGGLISDTTKDKYRCTYSIYYYTAEYYASNLSSGDQISINLGKSHAAKQTAYIGYKQGNTDNESRLVLGLHSVDNVFNLTASGNVLIGTTADNGAKLQVNGDIGFDNIRLRQGALASYILEVETSYGKSWFGMMNTYACHIYTDAPMFYMDKLLSVQELNSRGNIVATGSVTAKSSSDYRLKCEFDYNVDYQERLLSLGKVCDFNYTPHAQEREFAFADDKRHTSVIWQDARKANITGFCSVEEDGYGTINPLSSDLIFTMVGAIQQGIVKTERIEERVVRLEKENEALRKEINDMKGGRYGC